MSRYQTDTAATRRPRSLPLCIRDGCDGVAKLDGRCPDCYVRFARMGDDRARFDPKARHG